MAALAIPTAPAAARPLADTTVTAASAANRDCHTRALGRTRGVATKRLSAPATGWLRVDLAGRSGDWDVAVFDRVSGRLVAASAQRGAREVATGIVYAGEPLTVQACRRSGRARSARLSVESFAVDAGKAEKASLVRVAVANHERKRELTELGLDLTEHGGDGFVEVVLYGERDAAKLRRRNFVYTTEIADLVAQAAADRRADRAFARRTRSTKLPSGRTRYRQLADYQAEMKKLAADNPGLVRPIALPNKTFEGRTVEGIEITTDVNNLGDGKPVFLQMGVHHAREWPSSEHAMEWAYELVNGYKAGDERTRRLVESVRTIVVPIVNPDGFNISRTAGEVLGAGDGTGRGHVCPPQGEPLYEALQDEAGESCASTQELVHIAGIPYEYWRKNCRLVNDSDQGTCFQPPGNGVAHAGVDPNRNYGGLWGGPGAAGPDGTLLTFDATYRGKAPFSEPETRNVQALVSKRQVTTLITNHTFSNLVLRPPGIRAQGQTPDEEAYKALGAAMTSANGYANQFGYELYDTTGTTEDWSYWTTGGFGFTFEIGPEHFHPPFADTVAEYTGQAAAANGGGGNREAYFRAMEAAGDPQLHSLITGTAPRGATLRISKSFETRTSADLNNDDHLDRFPETLESTLVSDGGRFQWHVNPSTRPIATRDFSRPATGAPSPPQKVAAGSPGPDNRPCASYSTTNAACFDEHPFTVPSGPGIDNAKGRIRLSWPTPASDWDMKIFHDVDRNGSSLIKNESGAVVGEEPMIGSSGKGPTNYEETTVSEPDLRAGEQYLIRVINYAAVEPYSATITWRGPDKHEPARREAWTLSCEIDGSVVQVREVFVDRGEQANVGNPCASGGKPGSVPAPAVTQTQESAGAQDGGGAVLGARTASGSVRILSRSSRLSRTGYAAIRLQCSQSAACTGVLRLVQGRRLAGRGAYAIAAGQAETVRVRVARAVRARTARARRGTRLVADAGSHRRSVRLLTSRR